jgi:hypothetical protein
VPEHLRTFAEAAAEFRVSERTLRLLVARHGVPILRMGRRVLFDDCAIRYLIEAVRRPCAPIVESISAPYASSIPTVPPARSKVSAFDEVMALTKPALSSKRPARSNRPGLRLRKG